MEDLGPRGLFVRCITGFNSGPPMVPQSYNQNVQVFQTPDHVVLLNEMVHSARVVPLDGRPPLPSDSAVVGRLSRHLGGRHPVVTTTNFRDIVFEPARIWGGTGSRPHGMQLVLVERFTRTADETLLYQFTMNDPTWYAAPWTRSYRWRSLQSRSMSSPVTRENYGLENILAGARAEEAASEATSK